MKLSKKFILLISLLILSGCTSKYQLKINGNKFEEKITTFVYDGDREADLYDGIESGNRIDAYIDRDVYPFFENYDKVYKKKILKTGDYEKVTLNYHYKDAEYKNSNAVNLCFENRNFNIEKDYYDINLTGYFYCLYNNENLDIEIETSNKVLNNNADEKNGNKYIWHINQNNYKDVDIKMQVNKKSKYSKLYAFLTISIIILVLVVIILLVLKKVKKSNRF